MAGSLKKKPGMGMDKGSSLGKKSFPSKGKKTTRKKVKKGY